MNFQQTDQTAQPPVHATLATPIKRFENHLPDQFGLAKAMPEMVDFVRTSAYGTITIEITIRPNGDVWHTLWVSLGDGDLTSDSVGRVLPNEADLRSRAAQMARKAVEKKQETERRHAESRQERLRLIAEMGIRVGREWTGAQAYVQGRKGLTTYDRATVLQIDETGFVTVECYKRGMRQAERITTEPTSRLFETISNPVKAAAQPRQPVPPKDLSTGELFGDASSGNAAPKEAITLEIIAQAGVVRIENNRCRSGDGSVWTVQVYGKDGALLIGTSVPSDELPELVGPVAAASFTDVVSGGAYVFALRRLEVMGLRGTLVERIARNEWSSLPEPHAMPRLAA